MAINNMFRQVFDNFLVVVCLCLVPLTDTLAVDIQVYKGELKVLIPHQQPRNTLLLQYRTKTKEVLRIAVRELKVISVATKEATSLDDRTVSLSGRLDDGYWNTEIAYSDLDLGDDHYRIEGLVMFYLAGSQQTRKFSVYLKPEIESVPYGSGIDWDTPDSN